MKAISKFIFCFLIFFSSLESRSNYVFSPSVSYSERTTDSTTSEKSKLTVIDFRFGYTLDFGLYFGVLYSLQDEELNIESSDAYAGLSTGWMHENLFFVATYLLYGEKDLATGGVKYSKGEGFQFDLSYLLPIAEDIFLAPQLSYLTIDFKDRQVNGVSSDANFKTRGLTPAFNVTFKF